MVEYQLHGRGIADAKVLEVMGQLPRQHFIPAGNRSEAYLDQPVPIGFGQTISQPYIVALMTEKLGLRPVHIVLEVGTGCGYQTAILARMVKRVYTLELIEALSCQAQQNLRALGITNVEYRVGDGWKGWPAPADFAKSAPADFEKSAGPDFETGAAPVFDRILVAAGAETVPPALLEQLGDPGKMVIPVGPVNDQKLMLFEKQNENIKEKFLCYCRFVKLIQP